MIFIIDYGSPNLRNIQKALERIGYSSVISKDPREIKNADVLVLPGVGAYREAMTQLKRLGLVNIIREKVINKTPILGICLGMQLLSPEGMEGGKTEGLNILDSEIKKFEVSNMDLRIPHIGWNSVSVKGNSILFEGIPDENDFYFVHSYYMVVNEQSVEATCTYGEKFTCAVHNDNVFAVQFHPEKSQKYGLKVLKNFVDYCNTL